MAIAVDEKASATPVASAPNGLRPSRVQAASPIGKAVTIICVTPSTTMSRRMAFSRAGFRDRPIRNSSRTTPSCEMFRIMPGSATRASPEGPITMPAAR